ncbi:MAG TPA: ABC-2 family transporter protein [Capsulimonadaceae bacterium]|nr:ABC-2 family transporter protein [Capsulimonadaceae bacterium]
MASSAIPKIRPFKALTKWWAVYSVFFQDALVYKANATIWLMTDTVPAILMPLIWLNSYNGRATIGGFTPSAMVVYYMVVLFLTCVVESHIMWDMNNDVKQGKFNVYLTRPYSYMAYAYASNLSWRLMRTIMFVPLFAVVLWLFHPWVRWNPQLYDFGWRFWLAVVLGHVVSFGLTYAMGLLSLYLVEARSVYNFYYLPLVIFSGQIAPLTFFPQWMLTLARFLPFSYTLSLPAQIFIGHVHGRDVWMGYAGQLAWIAVSFSAAALLWRGGLKRYTAFGI